MRFPPADLSPQGFLELAYPIGSVYVSTLDVNPALLMGFGTWQAISAGRVLVGLDASQTEFDTLGETGGVKSVTLTEAQIPSHTHVQNAHTHVQNSASAATGGLVGSTPDATTSSGVASGYSTANATAVNQNTGGGQAHTNLQPYLVVKFWERTA